jgi:hypothetical protein
MADKENLNDTQIDAQLALDDSTEAIFNALPTDKRK